MRARHLIVGTTLIYAGALAGTWAAADLRPAVVLYGAESVRERDQDDLDRNLATSRPFAAFRCA